MYLLFDGVSTRGYIGLFDTKRNCIAQEYLCVSGNESTQVIPVIHDFLESQNVSYTDIVNICCVVWPGSFTGVRTISLVINTLSYIYPHIRLTPMWFFDLYSDYPVVKSSSKRDVFVKMGKNDTIQVLSNSDFEKYYTGETIYGDVNSERFSKKYEINGDIDYTNLFQNIVFLEQTSIAPMYIKKPNIS